jgi:hypothetical protein
MKPRQMIDSARTNKTSAKPSHTNTALLSHRLHSMSPRLDKVETAIGEDKKSDTGDIKCRKQKAKEAQSKAQLQPWNGVGR